MMPRLSERLNRLEMSHGRENGGSPMPREILNLLIVCIAFDLGGYPQAREHRQERDSLGDAFARGIGLSDRETLTRVAADEPDRWRAAVSLGVEALLRPAKLIHPDRDADDDRAWIWLLDRAAALKSERPDFPSSVDLTLMPATAPTLTSDLRSS